MSANTRSGKRGCRRWSHGLAALALLGSTAWAQVVTVPEAHLQHAEGSVAYAPGGDAEWHDVQPRRLLKRGDRLWTDAGSRAEIQAGGHAVRLDSETQVVLENVGRAATQLSITQGNVAASVTGVEAGASFEIGTPNLAFRARQPGDYRIDVEAVPLGAGRTFLHMRYAYGFGGVGRFAMQAYLATAGASKVGFTADGVRGAVRPRVRRRAHRRAVQPPTEGPTASTPGPRRCRSPTPTPRRRRA